MRGAAGEQGRRSKIFTRTRGANSAPYFIAVGQEERRVRFLALTALYDFRRGVSRCPRLSDVVAVLGKSDDPVFRRPSTCYDVVSGGPPRPRRLRRRPPRIDFTMRIAARHRTRSVA